MNAKDLTSVVCVHMADNTENTFQDHHRGRSASNVYIKSNYS